MKTVGEIDRSGNIVRVFHRNATAAWDHPPGQRYRYWTRTRDPVGRSVYGWVKMRCECPLEDTSSPSLIAQEVRSAEGGGPG